LPRTYPAGSRPGALRLLLVALGLGLGWAPGAAAASPAGCAGDVYLTFDTGNMAQAEEIARVLAAEDVRATFFLANERTARGDHSLDPSWASYWTARVAEGHVFGNHTWSHHYARRDLEGDRVAAVGVDGRSLELTRGSFCAELKRVDDAFQRMTGLRLAGLWRAPGGRVTQQTIRWAASCGYPVHVGWDEAGFLGDDLPSDAHPNAALLLRALERVAPGDVLMMHLGVWQRREPLAAILRPLIRGLKAKKLCFAVLRAGAR
jgi:peptidoglycan/xylan/chitin deacetylase (PgdA/CDA1 family)